MFDMLTYILYFVGTMLLATIGIFLLQKAFYVCDILDNPKKYWKKRKPIPYSMGIIFFIIFFLVSYFFIEPGYKLTLIWGFWCLVTAISFLDDMIQVSPKIRLLIQIFIGAIIGITSIKIGYVSSIFWWVVELDTHFITVLGTQIYTIPLLFTVAWYVFVFNALNWTDGIPGNTSSLSIISFFIIFLLGLKLYLTDDYTWGVENAEFIMKITLILLGILIPFWFFDMQEKILMGDSGTMFLGFMLATIAIISGGKIATVLVVFGIYAVDALYVVIRRIMRRKNPLKWDYTHLHHRLLRIGISQTNVLLLVWGLSFLFGLTALFLDRTGKIIVFGIIVVVVVFLNKILEKIRNIKYK